MVDAMQGSRPVRGWRRWLLRLAFLLFFGFAGGVLYLLFFLVPFEQWLADRGTSQGAVDVALAALVFGWALISVCATAFFSWFFLSRGRAVPAGLGVLGITALASLATFYFLLDTDFMVALGEMTEENIEGERFTYGSYPDARRIEELKDEGYDGVITLLNPDIPFENVLLKKELGNGEEAGIPIHSYPMLPWISDNESALREIEELTAGDEKRYYVHCYLGKHRVDYVRQMLDGAGETPAPEKLEPLPEAFERGRLVPFDGEQVVLGPYPTEEEWFNFVVRRDVEEVISTLDPENPDDAPWIEEERRIAEENGLTFTLRTLDAESPDPKDAQEIAAYAKSRGGKVYVHDFLESERFRALEAALRYAPSGTERDAASRPAGSRERSPNS
ncbi:hypothetical protein GBA65_02545 [Rubrobacter marinus]|uniref:Uncharacterized protein n=1 Tax=Rubrobacter marinus TaxID=2653852 RepID=A0A6G8PUC6_9ACTN|nr:hypothetical protein [Rubrobacter marinus]QIN77571.1 hypothetical protein GBA65_02545 [Rubrobacter marinus]